MQPDDLLGLPDFVQRDPKTVLWAFRGGFTISFRGFFL